MHSRTTLVFYNYPTTILYQCTIPVAYLRLFIQCIYIAYAVRFLQIGSGQAMAEPMYF